MLKVVEQRLALSFGIGVALLIGGFILLKLL